MALVRLHVVNYYRDIIRQRESELSFRKRILVALCLIEAVGGIILAAASKTMKERNWYLGGAIAAMVAILGLIREVFHSIEECGNRKRDLDNHLEQEEARVSALELFYADRGITADNCQQLIEFDSAAIEEDLKKNTFKETSGGVNRFARCVVNNVCYSRHYTEGKQNKVPIPPGLVITREEIQTFINSINTELSQSQGNDVSQKRRIVLLPSCDERVIEKEAFLLDYLFRRKLIFEFSRNSARSRGQWEWDIQA
jgi:hypothetical protein